MAQTTRGEMLSSNLSSAPSTTFSVPESSPDFDPLEPDVDGKGDTSPSIDYAGYEGIDWNRLAGFSIRKHRKRARTGWVWEHGFDIENTDSGHRYWLCKLCHRKKTAITHMYDAASTSQANSHMEEVHHVCKGGPMLPQRKKQRTLLDMVDLDTHQPKCCKNEPQVDQALMLLQEQIYKAWRMGKVLSLISFDVKGAYNGVCKERLLERLRARGIPEGLVRWIGAFCSERSASIVVNGHASARQELPQAGLPQGSPLSPILFLLFNAYLVQRKISTAGGSVAFVDDYSAWVTGPTAEANRAGLESIINNALEWEKRSGATFEADKTTVIHFTRMAERNSETPYTIKGQEVKPKSSAKILGVIMDSGLRYKEHMARAAAKGLSAAMDLRRLRMASPRMARQLSVATVAPTVDYASNIWSHACGLREAAWLDKAQRVGAQAITGTFRTVATAVAEAEASIQPLPEGVGKYSKRMDKALPGSHTRALYDTLTKREAKVLAQLRTGMSALNGYLHRIGVADSDVCDCGQAAETIEHFLFRCKKWTGQWEIMLQYSRTKMGNLSFFLGGKAATDDDKWRPDLEAMRAAVQFAMVTKWLDLAQREDTY
ncbi:reverse transcriptase [Purpureocillium lilacinum]|uniref:Reverse transcriptase n=1 Tax=Purpureocillium lilacinum TaxID=33203 RepID=A0A179FBU5_PURLI|nr:reverse transcriptase [Purpureocillium lilacinum]